VDSALSTWNAVRLAEIDGAGDVDDPAISPDGTVLVFGHHGGELWSARRDAIDQPFSTPKKITPVNDPVGNEIEPDLAALPSGELELFFRSDRGTPGSYRIYRSVCTH
jgi:hypothetical protein